MTTYRGKPTKAEAMQLVDSLLSDPDFTVTHIDNHHEAVLTGDANGAVTYETGDTKTVTITLTRKPQA